MEEENVNIPAQLNQQAQPEAAGMIPLKDGTSINPFDAPTPGESLTTSPEQKYPWETPPEYTEVQPFMEDLFVQLGEDRDRYIELLIKFLDKTPITEIAQVLLYTSVSKGKINPDLMLLLIEPVMYLLIAMAEQAGIEPVIYEGEDSDEPSEEDTETYMDESIKFNKLKPEQIRRTSVAPSLLSKVKELPTAEEAGIEEEKEEV